MKNEHKIILVIILLALAAWYSDCRLESRITELKAEIEQLKVNRGAANG